MASTLLAVVLLALAAATTAVVPTDPPAAANQQSPELLAEILDNLGFKELASGVQFLNHSLPQPVTVFAPSDDSLRRSRDFPVLLSDVYLAPGLYSAADLARLPFASKLDLQAGRCLTVTSTTAAVGSKIFVHGVEITRPDLYNDGRIAIHGLQSFVPASDRISCGDDPLSKMIREAVSVLQHGGYRMLAAEVDGLERSLLHNTSNMTVFGLDDQFILADGGMPFYIVPNQLLTHADLVRLPDRTALPTLDQGQRLVVTRSGAAGGKALRINGMSIKAPDVFCNAKIAVHGITETFSADYRHGFRPFSVDGIVLVIYGFVVVTLAKLVARKLADELHQMRYMVGNQGWGPHPRQD